MLNIKVVLYGTERNERGPLAVALQQRQLLPWSGPRSRPGADFLRGAQLQLERRGLRRI